MTITKLPARSTSLLLATLVLLTAGCSGPVWQFPGGALEGEEQALHLAELPTDCGVIQLETNPDDPYSVNVYCVLINGSIYIDPAEDRTWYQYIKASPKVRIRFDGSPLIHPAFAVVEKDEAVLSQFEADRIVLRLMPQP